MKERDNVVEIFAKVLDKSGYTEKFGRAEGHDDK